MMRKETGEDWNLSDHESVIKRGVTLTIGEKEERSVSRYNLKSDCCNILLQKKDFLLNLL
jgi:hypothetical protein